MKLLYFTLCSLISAHAYAETTFNVGFFEPIQESGGQMPHHSIQEIKRSLKIAEDVFYTKAKACGYRMAITEYPFRYDDAHKIGALAAQAVKKEWFIIGPRRSDLYQMTSKLLDLPSVSPLASKDTVFDLAPLHLTGGSKSKILMRELVAEVIKRGKQNATYVSFVPPDSAYSTELSNTFDQEAKTQNLKKLAEIRLSSEFPKIDGYVALLKKKKPDYVFIPAFWETTFHLISNFHKNNITTVYLGSGTWGDQFYGALASKKTPQNINAIYVRPYSIAEKVVERVPLCGATQSCKNNPPKHSAGAFYVGTAANLADFVCDARPKTATEFKSKFIELANRYFNYGQSITVFENLNGKTSFYEKSIK